jgi:BASS family bile acid:Na+ symporter
LHLPRDVTIGMILLGAAPFAPVVPVFTRMAKGDLALAAGGGAIPSAAPTPLLCELCLKRSRRQRRSCSNR